MRDTRNLEGTKVPRSRIHFGMDSIHGLRTGSLPIELLLKCSLFKPHAPPERRLAKAAYLSYHAVIVIVRGIDAKTPPPPQWENMISWHFMQF